MVVSIPLPVPGPPTASAAVEDGFDADAAGLGLGFEAVLGFLGGTTTPGNSLRFLPPFPPVGFVAGAFVVEAIGGEVEEARGGDIDAVAAGRSEEEEEPARIGGGGAADRFVTALHGVFDLAPAIRNEARRRERTV